MSTKRAVTKAVADKRETQWQQNVPVRITENDRKLGAHPSSVDRSANEPPSPGSPRPD